MEDYRWTISELLARYELEPELADVFVEGQFDCEVLRESSPQTDVKRTFYQVDTVDIPPKTLANYELTSGNKQRLIALSRELTQAPANSRVFCLIDRDLDHWFGSLHDTPRLRWSTFCSIEAHFIAIDTIQDVLIKASRAKIEDIDVFISSLFEILRQLYSLRLADRDLQLNLKWIPLHKYLRSHSACILFDSSKYTLALLNKNAVMGKKAEFVSSASNWRNKLDCDIRLACRGHDYTELLAWAVSEFRGKRDFANADAISRLLVLLARSIPSLVEEVEKHHYFN